MNQNRPLLILGAASAVMVWIWFQTSGGIDGIRRDPLVSFGVLGVMALIAIPLFWFRYRRLKQEPMYVEVKDPAPDASPDSRLDHTPIRLEASRFKLLLLSLTAILGCAYFAFIALSQPGVCRVVGLAAIAPWAIAVPVLALVRLIGGESLEITPHALAHTTLWSTRQWPWDEVRNIAVIKARPFGIEWTTGIRFTRFTPDANTSASPRPFLRPVWSMKSDDLAQLLNAARLKWSTTAGTRFVALRPSFIYYLMQAYVWGLVAAVIWLMIGHPCSPNSPL